MTRSALLFLFACVDRSKVQQYGSTPWCAVHARCCHHPLAPAFMLRCGVNVFSALRRASS